MKSLRRRWPRLAEVVAYLHAECPLRYPLRLEVHRDLRVDGDGCFGATFISNNRPHRLTIRLDRGIGFWLARDALIHEWAHAMTLETGHDRAWGSAYARAYRAVYEGSRT